MQMDQIRKIWRKFISGRTCAKVPRQAAAYAPEGQKEAAMAGAPVSDQVGGERREGRW